MGKSVTALVPTLGRKSLFNAIKSIQDQSHKIQKILVVDDSLNQDVDIGKDETITLIRTGGKTGPAYARNLGLGLIETDWVAFLDDDDYWLPNHVERLLEFCASNNLDAAYSSALISGLKRPKVLYQGNVDPLTAVYDSPSWRKTKHYLPTPGLMISKEVVGHLSFNNNLNEREDLWFAHKIFEYQFRIRQSSEATLIVNQSSIRSIERTSLEADLSWAQRLELVDSSAKVNFLAGTAFRNAVVRRDLRAIRKISKLYPNHNWFFRLIASL
jgi:glycosyltransferase involved in cell wall biosynthesis